MKTVDVTTKQGLHTAAKGALVGGGLGATASTVVVSLLPNHWVDVPSVVVATLLLCGAGYGISRIGAEVSDSGESSEHADGETVGEEQTHAAEAAS